MAHYTPFPGDAAQNDARWIEMFAAAGLPAPVMEQRYSLVEESYPGRAPPYFNAGFMAMNREGWQLVTADIDRCARAAVAPLRALGRDFFAIQVAMTLAIARQSVRVVHLGLEYNCPNDDVVFLRGIGAEENVRVLHFLREHDFTRQQFLSDPAAFARFATGPLSGRMNQFFRQFILDLVRRRGEAALFG
jgi:hypothetical protein